MNECFVMKLLDTGLEVWPQELEGPSQGQLGRSQNFSVCKYSSRRGLCWGNWGQLVHGLAAGSKHDFTCLNRSQLGSKTIVWKRFLMSETWNWELQIKVESWEIRLYNFHCWDFYTQLTKSELSSILIVAVSPDGTTVITLFSDFLSISICNIMESVRS